MTDIGVLVAQFDVPENKVLYVEDDTTAKGTPDDPRGVFVSFGGIRGSGELTVFLPDETAARLLVTLLTDSPRIPKRTMARIRGIVEEATKQDAEAYRARLDPGPLPLEA
jgi:class 3 adenylate cyclase